MHGEDICQVDCRLSFAHSLILEKKKKEVGLASIGCTMFSTFEGRNRKLHTHPPSPSLESLLPKGPKMISFYIDLTSTLSML